MKWVARRNIRVRICLHARRGRTPKALLHVCARIRVSGVLLLVDHAEQAVVVARFRVVDALERHRAGFCRMNVDTADSRRVVHALVIALIVAVRVQRKLVSRTADIRNRPRACVHRSI